MITLYRSPEFSSHLTGNLWKLKLEETLTDFCITTSTSRLPCHRVLLAANSPVLKAAILTDMTEAHKGEISLDSISGVVVEFLLLYMYKGEVIIEPGQLWDLVMAADYLQMATLKQECINHIPDHIRPCNVISWYKLAYKLNLESITVTCSKMMVASMQDITKTEGFFQLDITEIQDYFNHLLEQNINRDQLLVSGMAWASHSADGRINHLEELLQNINLEDCSHEVLKEQYFAHTHLLDSRPTAYKLFATAVFGAREKTTVQKSVALEIWKKRPTQRSKTEKPDEKKNKKKNREKQVLAVVGGYQGGKVNRQCWYLHTQKQQMIKLTQIPLDCCFEDHSACQVADGFVVTGGEDSDVCAKYTSITKSWSRLKNMMVRRWCHCSISVQGILFVFGGYVNRQPSGRMDYLAQDGEWRQGPNMPLPMTWPKVASPDDEHIYLMDEKTSQLFVMQVWRKVWKQRASVPGPPCLGVGMTAAQGMLCVVGGKDPTVNAWYTPATDTWSTGLLPQLRHWRAPVVQFEQKMYILGGRNVTEGVDEVEKYDIEKESWTEGGLRLPKPLQCHYAMVLDIPQ